jgi:ribosomal protein S18 acetylase RimI-like enzyme
MSKIVSEQVELKTGEEMIIRSAVADDAEKLLENAKVIFAEDSGFVTRIEEFNTTVEQQRKLIREHNENPGRVILIAEVDGIIAGSLWLRNSSRKRLEHRGILNLSIQPQYRRCGIATALLEALFRWARKNPIVEKLALAVFTTNVPAITLYKKNGFIEEGRRIKEVKMADGQYVDDILMYKLVKE